MNDQGLAESDEKIRRQCAEVRGFNHYKKRKLLGLGFPAGFTVGLLGLGFPTVCTVGLLTFRQFDFDFNFDFDFDFLIFADE